MALESNPTSQDLRRNRDKYHDLLLALNHAAREIRAMAQEGSVSVDRAFGRLLPDVTAALQAKEAFVARLSGTHIPAGEAQSRELRMLAVYPRRELEGSTLACVGVVKEVVDLGGPIVHEPLEEEAPLLPGLELFAATRGILVRKEIAGRIYVVAACNKANRGDVFLSYDRMALDDILELIVFGALMGEQRRHELANIHRISAEISAELQLDELLPTIAQRAAGVFGAPAASLMLWDEPEEQLIIRASEGLSDDYCCDLRIPRDRVMAKAGSDGAFRPVFTPDLNRGAFGQPDLVAREGLCSVLSAPLLSSGKLVGALNVYSKGEVREFSEDQIELAEILANQAAVAIKNAELRERERVSLLATTEALRVSLDLDSLLPLLVTQTSQLFRLPASLMLWDSRTENLTVRAMAGALPDCCRTIAMSRGALQALLGTDGDFAPQQVPDLAASPFCPAQPCDEHARSLLMVPLVANDEAIGVLNVYGNGDSRTFRADEVELAQILANQAAIAIQNANLHARSEQRGEQLEALDAIALDVARRLQGREVLETIVARATELVGGSGGGVYLWNEAEHCFMLEAVHELPEDELLRRRFTGERGAIGKVLRERRTVAIANYSEWDERLEEFEPYGFQEVVAAPISSPNAFHGVIAVHTTQVGRSFDKTDEALLSRFGTHAAAALENARAYAAEQQARDYSELLLRSSLDAIVATDVQGRVTVFNESAEQMLGSRAGEVVGRMQVCDLFHDPQRAQDMVDRLLTEGKIQNREVCLRASDGQDVPALVSAAALRGPAGDMVGGVAFLQDLRSLRKVESELRILLETMRTVAGAQDTQGGLQTLARNMRRALDIGFCHILVLNREGDTLEVGAACVHDDADRVTVADPPGSGMQIDLAEKIEMQFLLELQEPKVFYEGDLADRWVVTKHIEEVMRLERSVAAVLVVPLRAGGKGFGVCALGRMRDDSRGAFDKAAIDLAYSMASQAAVLIDRARLFEQVNEDATRLREGLLALGHELAQLRSREETLQAIADGVKEMLACDLVTVYAYDARQDIFPCPASRAGDFISPAKMEGMGPLQKHPVLGPMLARVEPHFVEDVTLDDLMRDSAFVSRERIVSTAGAPLQVGGEWVGLLFANYRRRHVFSETEQRAFRIVANQAAIAIYNTEQYYKLRRQSEHRLALHEAGKILTAGMGAGRSEVLDRITEQAVEHIRPLRGGRATWGYIALHDSVTEAMQIESVYPAPDSTQASVVPGHRWSLRDGPSGPAVVGIAGRAVLDRAPCRVADRDREVHWLQFHADTLSGVAVPLRDGEQIVGALCLESLKVAALDADDERALEGLAELAVLGIKNAERTEQLARTNTVAILGAWGAEMLHDVNREVGAIRRAAYILTNRDDLPGEVGERLAQIDAAAAALDLPLLPEHAPPPGQPLDQIRPACLDQVLATEVQRVQATWPHVEFDLALDCPGVEVAMDEQWLRRMARHLLSNAVMAIPLDYRVQQIRVRTFAGDTMADVYVEDSGKGVAADLLPILFHRPVPRGGERLGRGLLLLRFLAEQHGGRVRLVNSEAGRTCFAFSVPLAGQGNSE